MTRINLRSMRLRVICIAITMLTLNSCTSGSDPIAVAEQFATAYCDTNFDKCNKLMFEDAKNRFVSSSDRSEAEKQFFKMMQDHFKKMKYKLKLNNDKTEVLEKRARVVFDVTSATESSFSDEFTVRLDKDEATGKWLVYKYNNPF